MGTTRMLVAVPRAATTPARAVHRVLGVGVGHHGAGSLGDSGTEAAWWLLPAGLSSVDGALLAYWFRQLVGNVMGDARMAASGVTIHDGGRLWVMYGEIDAAVRSRCEDELHRTVRSIGSPARIDLAAVTFMDSGGLHLLDHASMGRGPSPRLTGTPQRVRDLLEMSGLARLFDFQE
jgi:anti-sigma B factor antagonist